MKTNTMPPVKLIIAILIVLFSLTATLIFSGIHNMQAVIVESKKTEPPANNHQINWTNINTNGAYIFRCRTPNGWLIHTGKDCTYIPDIEHKWLEIEVE